MNKRLQDGTPSERIDWQRVADEEAAQPPARRAPFRFGPEDEPTAAAGPAIDPWKELLERGSMHEVLASVRRVSGLSEQVEVRPAKPPTRPVAQPSAKPSHREPAKGPAPAERRPVERPRPAALRPPRGHRHLPPTTASHRRGQQTSGAGTRSGTTGSPARVQAPGGAARTVAAASAPRADPATGAASASQAGGSGRRAAPRP